MYLDSGDSSSEVDSPSVLSDSSSFTLLAFGDLLVGLLCSSALLACCFWGDPKARATGVLLRDYANTQN